MRRFVTYNYDQFIIADSKFAFIEKTRLFLEDLYASLLRILLLIKARCLATHIGPSDCYYVLISLKGQPPVSRASASTVQPNLVRDIFERALEALKMIHAYTRNHHGCCCQFHVRSHALESRSGFYSQALTS